MNLFMREFRLIPMVLFATVTLLVLKVAGFVVAGGYTLASPRPAKAEDIQTRPTKPAKSWAQEVLGYPDVTGSVDKPPAEKESPGKAESKPDGGKGDGKAAGATAATGDGKAEGAKPGAAAPPPNGSAAPPDNTRPISPAERAVLERLQERRQELDQRARELDIREGLLGAAEKRLEARVIELKDVEARINAAMAKKDVADAARIKSLVTMYENMKPKEAARIFDRLDLRILIDVASQINPRRMSDILAQMSSEAAERLTVELATRSNQPEKMPATSDLPKIEGRPQGQPGG